MIQIWCRNMHKTQGLCEECNTLLDYALKRLDQCPYSTAKPACSRCSIHCYKPDMRLKVREIMRYSGSRMLMRHPILAMWHLLDRLKPEPSETD